MKWLPINEIKPENSFFMTNSCIYTDGNKTVENWIWEIPEGMTHWLDIGELPPLPKPKDEPAIGHFNLTPHKCFLGDVVSNVNEPIKMKEKPKDPDWAKFDEIYKDAGLNFKINAIYEFLKAKYDRTD